MRPATAATAPPTATRPAEEPADWAGAEGAAADDEGLAEEEAAADEGLDDAADETGADEAGAAADDDETGAGADDEAAAADDDDDEGEGEGEASASVWDEGAAESEAVGFMHESSVPAMTVTGDENAVVPVESLIWTVLLSARGSFCIQVKLRYSLGARVVADTRGSDRFERDRAPRGTGLIRGMFPLVPPEVRQKSHRMR